jgi:hypothetical protein
MPIWLFAIVLALIGTGAGFIIYNVAKWLNS